MEQKGPGRRGPLRELRHARWAELERPNKGECDETGGGGDDGCRQLSQLSLGLGAERTCGR